MPGSKSRDTDQIQLIVTGTSRSGTTFTDRVLDNLPMASCASQPFPYLYLDVKRRFLEAQGVPVPAYPVGAGFHDPLHRPEPMREFLATHQIDSSRISSTFKAMEGYNGARTSELAEVIDLITPGSLGDVVCSLHSLLAERRTTGARIVASKENWLEEFSPALSDGEIRTLIVVRDPRSVVASTIGPSARDWDGLPRPLLYTIRLWRKSVAYGLRAGRDTQMLRFEDLKEDPARTLEGCFQAFQLAVDIEVPPTLRGTDGTAWQPNTSYPDDRRPRENFGLTEGQLAYVEALAFPEMLALGYEPVTDVSAAERAIETFRTEDDPGRRHRVFTPDFSVDPRQLALERERLARLRAGDVDDGADWFVLPEVGRYLADALIRSPA